MDGKSAGGNDEPDIRECERRKIAVRISRAQQERPSETNEPGARQNKHTHTHTHTIICLSSEDYVIFKNDSRY